MDYPKKNVVANILQVKPNSTVKLKYFVCSRKSNDWRLCLKHASQPNQARLIKIKLKIMYTFA